ncbi:MAG: PEP-CTERM sorting domain-containing protein [Acidobacteria bacterium]|nr:PEP-CTERM sorting domain-containing protein [Acidobacteriota bacterium]
MKQRTLLLTLADVEYYDPYPALPNLFSLRSRGTFQLKGTDTVLRGVDVLNNDGSWTWTLVRPSVNGGFRVDVEGFNPDNQPGAFHVTFSPEEASVPEPGSLSMLLCGGALIAVGRLRRRGIRK